MAYSYSRSHSRNSSTGLGSSISCLDGVPFKVGPKFKPPPRVFLPPELSDVTKTSQVVNDEYMFETEEAVLRWAQAREEAKIEQERLKAEKVANAIQELSQPRDSDNSDSSGGEENGAASVPFQSNALVPEQSPQPPPRLAFANMSNDILTPVPIAPAKAVEPEKTESTQAMNFDLALFEREDDPFENVERQLINEMEELKSVLEPFKPTTDKPLTNATNNCDTNITNNLSNGPAFNGPVSNSTVPNLPPQQNASENVGSGRPVFVPRNQPYEEGDYVELRVDYNNETSNSVAYKVNDTSSNILEGGVENGRTVNPAASAIYKSVLPPIGTPVSKTRPLSTPEVNSLMKNSAAESTSLTSRGPLSGPNSGLANGVLNKYSRHTDSSPIGYTQQSEATLRTAKSNPDLSCSEPRMTSQVFPLSHSPPPRPSSGQLWNPYKPLPSTPDIMRSSGQSPSDDSSSSDMVSPSEFDPYTRLSQESQKFVDNFVSMGFSQPQVARAVHHHGTDEKQVVEYLCHVTKLTDKGFNAIHAETALNLFDNNLTKAERYMEMFTQFQELGFGEAKIREALVKENMDRDKALDFLTA